jgi:hypothetical protein
MKMKIKMNKRKEKDQEHFENIKTSMESELEDE